MMECTMRFTISWLRSRPMRRSRWSHSKAPIPISLSRTMAHLGRAAALAYRAATRLADSGVLSIAVVRGRVRGGGSEFALGGDIRFASRGKAIFWQPLIPGGGALERLPLLV